MRFEIESKMTREAHEDRFAEYTAWLRDTKTGAVHVFTGRTRESVKAQAVSKAREIRDQASDFGFVCSRTTVGWGRI